MIHFTHNDFELDLSNFNVSFQEKNSWFGTLFSVVSFPIDIPLEGYFLRYKNFMESDYPSLFEGVLNRNGKLSKAELKITDFDDDFLRIQIESGLEQFPSWDTKLADLPLQQITVENIRSHANSIITKSYPEVNYNFPMIHCDAYDSNNRVWEHFEKIYNKRVGGSFIENSIDVPNNEVFNRNIMRAFPYMLHIVEAGIKAGNCTLHGSILQDEDIREMVLISPKLFEMKDRPGSVNWITGIGDFTAFDTGNYFGVFEGIQEILHYGKFRIKGKLAQTPIFKEDAVLTLNGVELWRGKIWRETSIDIIFTTNYNVSDELKLFYIGDMRYDSIELEITPIVLWDENGNEIQYLADTNIIDLRYLVPDTTFGNVINYLMSQKNYSFDLKNGNEIHMNVKETFILPTDAVDLTGFEVRSKTRELSSVDSFELSYMDTGNDNYPAEKIFYNKQGSKITDYQINDKTQKVEINGIPLPIETSSEITTSKLITTSEDAICIALYNGLQNGQNVTKSIQHFRAQNVLNNYYKRFFNFQLNAVSYLFVIRKYVTDITQFSIYDKLYIFDNYHFNTEQSVTRIAPNVDEYSIKTLTIRPGSV